MMSDEQDIETLLKQGRYRDCLRVYFKRLRKDRSPTNLANAAGCLYKLTRFNPAKLLAEEAVSLSKNSCYQATLVLANIEFDRKNNLTAWRLYKSLFDTSLNAHGWHGVAMICKKRSQFRLTEAILKALLASNPDKITNLRSICNLYVEREQYKDAIPHLRKWLETSPDSKEALETGYICALRLKESQSTQLIAEKLTQIDPSQPKYFEWLGLSLNRNAEDCNLVAEAFAKAYSLRPDTLAYFINLSIACNTIASNGSYAHLIAEKLIKCSSKITELIKNHYTWQADGGHPILNSTFFVAYSAINLKHIYSSYFNALISAYRPFLNQSLRESESILELYSKKFAAIDIGKRLDNTENSSKMLRIGFISQNFFDHSNSQAFAGIIKYLDRSRFTTILVHKYPTKPDWTQSWINSLADEVVYLGLSFDHAHATLCRLELDILFFTDLGMDAWDFILPEMRACKLQVTGWGLPHTSGLRSIDYYLSSSLLEQPKHQDEYSEQLVLLDGLPCCFLSDFLVYNKQPRDYFFLPSNQLIIGCVQSLSKVHPDLDLIIEEIAKQVPEAYFAFICDRKDNATSKFCERLTRRAPTASQRLLMLERCFSKDFLSLCDCFDFMLDTPYYGAGITAYMSTYVGTPVVCLRGTRLRDSTMAAIYNFLKIKDAPIASNMREYIDLAVRLSRDFDLRLKIKIETVAAAPKLYDQQDYVRGFEEFCLNIIQQSAKTDSNGSYFYERDVNKE